ncbi:MAG: hypothetical protein JRF02_05600 [Deltaproteobacteria bacterium]|jgi:hypothetical protein|nr:hypothetical protein [Deltaproteobacteria bacterium]
MRTKTVQYLLLIPGIVGIGLLGYLGGLAAPGSQYVLWVVVPLFILFFIRRYPIEEICAFFGLTFGWVLLVVCGGAFYLAVNEQLVFAGLWLVVGLVLSIVFLNPISRKVMPTIFIVETFSAMVGPIPQSRELPRGCFLVTSEILLFLALLMTVGLLGPLLWFAHILLYKVFVKVHREKKIGWVKIFLFIITNILALFVLYFVLKNLGAEPVVRKMLGG